MSDYVYVVLGEEPEEIGVYTNRQKAIDAKTQIGERSRRPIVAVKLEVDAPPQYVGTMRSTL